MSKTSTNRNFGFIMTGGFLVLGFIIPFIKHRPAHLWLISLSLVFLLFAFFAPTLLEKPRILWLKLGHNLGIINTRLLFTFIYLSLFSLVHFIFIILRRDKLKSVWKKYPSTFQQKNEISSFCDPF